MREVRAQGEALPGALPSLLAGRVRQAELLALAVSDVATDCDRCHADIPYGVTCYSVATGRTWDVDDGDLGKPIVQIVCATCYAGPAKSTTPTSAILEKETP